jgi:hypothetical protein
VNTLKGDNKLQIDPERQEAIATLIHSDTSPVGIDAKKTHILIIQMLQEIQDRLDRLESRLDAQQSER